jgi:hypothetical protein
MKKNKSRSKSHSASKKIRKELESKLALVFNELVSQYGKAKKTDKVIEKFAKQLTKKVTIATQDDSIAPFTKEDKPAPTAPKTKTVKPVAEKKAKAVVKEAVE